MVVELEKLDEVSCDKLELLERCLRNIKRMDLVKKIQAHQNRGQSFVRSLFFFWLFGQLLASREKCTAWVVQHLVTAFDLTMQT